MPRACASSRASSGSSYARASSRSQNPRRRPRPAPASRESSTAICAAVSRISPACSSIGREPVGNTAIQPSRVSPARNGKCPRPRVGRRRQRDAVFDVALVRDQIADRGRDRAFARPGDGQMAPLRVFDQHRGIDRGGEVRGERLRSAAAGRDAGQPFGVGEQRLRGRRGVCGEPAQLSRAPRACSVRTTERPPPAANGAPCSC